MTTRKMRLGIALVLACASGLAGCSTVQGTSASRSAVYDSVKDILQDTTDVVVGTALRAESVETDEEGSTTLTEFSVASIHTPERSGARIAEFGVSVGSIARGDIITIRQPGSRNDTAAPVPLLEPGTTYLLFLNPAAIDGEAATHFTVVGVSAGLYVKTDEAFIAITETEAWARMHGAEPIPDKLPATLAPDSLS